MKTTTLAVLLTLAAACAPRPPASPPGDGGVDAGHPGPDAGAPDAGTPDDGGTPDGGPTCSTAPDCASEIAFSTRLDVDAMHLNALRLQVCWGTTCATAAPRLTSGDSAGAASASCASTGALTCTISRRADGHFNATVALRLATGVVPADGDTVSLTVLDSASGATLVSVTRQAIFEPADPAAACSCRAARQFVLASSASNVSCDTKPCVASAQFTGTAAAAGTETSAQLCRGSACVTAPLAWDDTASSGGAAFGEPLAGARLVLSRLGAGYHFTLEVGAAPDELADGDEYRLSIGGMTVFDRTVTYDTTTPNTAACDVSACRSATVALP
jgi:hypothetical protein